MSRVCAFLLLGPLLILIGCNGGDGIVAPPAVSADELAQAGLEYYWSRDIGLLPGETLARIWQLDEKVYCLTDANRVVALDAVAGTFAWTYRVGAPSETVFAPSHADRLSLPENPRRELAVTGVADALLRPHNVVLFSTNTHVDIIDRSDGTLLHRIDLLADGVTASTSAVTDGEYVFFGTAQGRLQAFSVITGIRAWQFGSGAAVTAAPQYRRLLYVASIAGRVTALLPSQEVREPQWAQDAGGAFVADFVVTDQAVFAGNRDNSVYALDADNGRLLWRWPLGGPINEPVQIGQTTIYALAEGEALNALALDLTSTRVKWRVPDGRMVLAEQGGQAQVLSAGNELMVVDAESGQVETVVPLTGLNRFVGNTSVPAIFAGHARGRLVCIRPRGAGRLTVEQLRAGSFTPVGPAGAATTQAQPTGATAPAGVPAVPPSPLPILP